MAKTGRQTPNRKPYKAPFITHIIKKHHAAYRVYKGALWFFPIYENGSIDYSRGELIRESPKAFKIGHQMALIALGMDNMTRLKKIIKKIDYY